MAGGQVCPPEPLIPATLTILENEQGNLHQDCWLASKRRIDKEHNKMENFYQLVKGYINIRNPTPEAVRGVVGMIPDVVAEQKLRHSIFADFDIVSLSNTGRIMACCIPFWRDSTNMLCHAQGCDLFAS
jgi:hypothetical protein